MGAAMSQILDPTSFDDIHYVIEGSLIREKLRLRGNLSPALMSDLSEDIGKSLCSMDDFFKTRIKRSSSDYFALDLTSVSSYSHMGGWSEWGHNRDDESLKQTNTAMVTDGAGIQVMFRILPGSVADMSVLKPFVREMKELGCNGRLVMDRGFESAANIHSLLKSGITFTIPSNARSEPVKKLISMAISDMKLSSAFNYHERNSYKTVEYELGIYKDENNTFEYVIHLPKQHKDSKINNEKFKKSMKLKVFVVYDPKKAVGDINSIMNAVTGTELKLEGTKPRDPDKVYNDLPAFIRRFVTYNVDSDGVMHIQRKQNAFTFIDNRSGIFVMLTSPNTSWKTMMTSYDVRDWVEKAFDVYKNDIDGGRSRTGNPDRARGRLFIKFVALILRITIQNILRNHDLDVLEGKCKKDSVNGKTVDEVIRSLRTLKVIGNTGEWRLSAVTKIVKEIFKLFNLSEPTSGEEIVITL